MTTRRPTDRLAYDDSASIGDLQADALRCGIRLRRRDRAPAPSIRYDEHPRDAVKPEISPAAAAQRIAAALGLYLD